MRHFSEMEWNAKRGWENFVGIGSKAIESPKKLQLTDWMIADDGEIHGGSFNLSGCGNSGASGSDGGHGSSAKSSVSASTGSSIKDGMQTSNFRFSTIEGPCGNLYKKMEMKEMELSWTSPPLEASAGSAEALLSLKLGKRAYLDTSSEGNVKSTSSSVIPASSTTTLKKTKSSAQNAPIFCQVDSCDIDLSLAKEYHRKHRVCDSHSKCPKVVVGGRERRFCQQCSRFHSLSEFDEKKRSCRRRLSDHNARRRKPQQETIQFNSTRLSTPFYGGSQQMSYLFNSSSLIHSRSHANSAWDSACNSKFTLTKEYPLKSNGDGGTDEQLHMPGIKMPLATSMQNAAYGLLATKNSTSVVSYPGSKGSLVSSPDVAPDYRRALSLLSSSSWDSFEPESTPLHNQMHEHDYSIIQPMIQAITEGLPLSSLDFWLSGRHSAHHPHVPSLATNSNFQETQLFKAPYDTDLY